MGRNSGVKKASILPLVFTIGFLLVSILLYLLRNQIANNFVYVIGYLLTPIAVSATLAWDSLGQRLGQQNPNFDVRPSYTRVIRILALAGFVVAVFHILELGRILGQMVVQSGVAQ